MEHLGVWLVGARGSIAAVTIAGQAAWAAGLTPPSGLVTQRPEFAEADLPAPGSFVFGGHEIRQGHLPTMAKTLLEACGVFGLAEQVTEALEAAEAWIRPGVVRGAGERIGDFADSAVAAATDADAVALIRADLDAFKAAHGLDKVVVVNVASTEPPAEIPDHLDTPEAVAEAMKGETPVLPASSLYAWAAFEGGDAYINFTPSAGGRPEVVQRFAEARGAVQAGSDGKTGETLVKSVLAELFARRGLPVLSWFGTNILGNDDGLILNDPRNKATKIKSKDHLLGRILGQPPHTHVGIHYVPSLEERKVAWDYIHFEGFLRGRMSLQFTWDGVDSLLAAPLVLDLVRLCTVAWRRGEVGVIKALAPFFKDPMGTTEQRLIQQDEALLAWIRGEGDLLAEG